jgi:hypothetical protein
MLIRETPYIFHPKNSCRLMRTVHTKGKDRRTILPFPFPFSFPSPIPSSTPNPSHPPNAPHNNPSLLPCAITENQRVQTKHPHPHPLAPSPSSAESFRSSSYLHTLEVQAVRHLAMLYERKVLQEIRHNESRSQQQLSTTYKPQVFDAGSIQSPR